MFHPGPLALLLLSCCSSAFVATRPYPAPPADELLGALARRQEAVRAMDLGTRTTSWREGERVAAGVDMLVERAGRLRFDVEVSLQGNVASLVTDGREFASVDLRAGIFRKGPACADNVSSMIGIPLVPGEIAAILLGDAPRPPGASAAGVAWDGGRAADVLAIEARGAGVAAEATRRLWVSFHRRRDGRVDIVAVEGEAEGGRWRVSYEDLEDQEGHSFPRLIRFAEPGHDFDEGVEIKVKSRALNPAVRVEAFALTPPQGFKTETLPCCRGCEVRVR